MRINQISVFVENKPGRLAKITGVLAEGNIDIRAFSMADTTDFGIMRMIVNDPDKAIALLKAQGLTVSKTNVLAARLPDSPGALHRVLAVLSDAQVNVEYAYAFLTKEKNDAFVILRVEEIEKAGAILAAAGIFTLSAEEVYGL